MNCNKCNKNNRANSKFCIYCGTRLSAENNVNPEQDPNPQSSSNDINKKISELDRKIELILNALSEQGIIKVPIDESTIEIPSETVQEDPHENILVTSDEDVAADELFKYANCKLCGNQNEFNNKFCVNCGSSIEIQEDSFAGNYDTPSVDNQSATIDTHAEENVPLEEPVPTEPISAVRQSKSFKLDSILGRNWLAGIGIVSIIIGVIFLATLSEVIFILIPPILSVSFLILSELWKTKYPKFAQALGGGGIGILYAYSWLYWKEPVIPIIITLITSALAAILALRHNSSYIAILGMVGAFLTPNILNIQKINFGLELGVIIYIIAVNISVIALATFKTWRWFTLIALIGTLLTFYSWYDQIGIDLPIIQSQISLTILFLIFIAATTLFHLIWKKASTEFDYILIVINALGYLLLSYLIMYDNLTEWMGLFTLAVASVYLAISIISYFRIDRHNHLTLMSIGLTVTLLTTAIAVQFGDEHQWRTVFWSVQAAVLMFLATKLSMKPLKLLSLIILGLTVVSIIAGDSFKALTLEYPERLNPYLASYILTIAAFLASAYISHYWDKDNHKYPYERYIPHTFFSAAILVSAIAVPVLTEDPWSSVAFSLLSISLVTIAWRLNLQFVRWTSLVTFALGIIWLLIVDTPSALKLTFPEVLSKYLVVYLVISATLYASAYISFKSITAKTFTLTHNTSMEIKEFIDKYTVQGFLASANILTAVATAVLLENPWISLGFAIKATLLVFLGETFKNSNLRWLSIPSLILSIVWILGVDAINASSLSITEALNSHLLPYILTLSFILITAYYIYRIRITDSLQHRIMFPLYLYSGLALSIIAPLVFDEKAWHISIIWSIQIIVFILISRKFKLIEFDVSNLLLIIILSLKLILFDLIAHISLDTLTPVWNYTILSFLAGILAIYFSAYITKTWDFENPIKIKMPDLEDFIIGKIYILAGLIITANILTFSILNLEVIKTIDYFFGNMEDLNNIKSLSLSLVWAIYAIVIISTGIIIRLSKVRLAGMGLMFVPIIKLYVYDLWNLENIYRVSLFLILGLILVIGGFLYQKYTERIKEFLSEDSDSKYNTAIQDKYTQ
tara:strand:+ start:6064 stop:9327 length:3264 start_codon:yes stop_codon:yes gene_type:complete